jgi:cytochrome oxidase Cu insertion factor (SCO1/SenC/PrrC family)
VKPGLGMHVRRVLASALMLFAQFACAQSARQETPRDEPRAQGARLMNELMSGNVPVGTPFTLTGASGAQIGKRVSRADFRGKLVLLYFGYTSCPDVCPTDLLAMAQTVKSLGKQGEQVQLVFVTLDPARDTPEVLRGYAAAFHPRLIALTGSEDEIRRVATAYKIFYEKVRIERADLYLIDHAAFTFLLDRSGKYVLFFPPGTSPERMAVMVQEQLAAK